MAESANASCRLGRVLHAGCPPIWNSRVVAAVHAIVMSGPGSLVALGDLSAEAGRPRSSPIRSIRSGLSRKIQQRLGVLSVQ